MSASKNNRLSKLVEMMRFISNIAFTDENKQKQAIAAWNSSAGEGANDDYRWKWFDEFEDYPAPELMENGG